jgi:hypothetical protein
MNFAAPADWGFEAPGSAQSAAPPASVFCGAPGRSS